MRLSSSSENASFLIPGSSLLMNLSRHCLGRRPPLDIIFETCGQLCLPCSSTSLNSSASSSGVHGFHPFLSTGGALFVATDMTNSKSFSWSVSRIACARGCRFTCHLCDTTLSVRPSSSLAISAKRLPSLLCAATILLSSSSVHASALRFGSTLFRYLWRHCFGARPGTNLATSAQFLKPTLGTISRKMLSSSSVHCRLSPVATDGVMTPPGGFSTGTPVSSRNSKSSGLSSDKMDAARGSSTEYQRPLRLLSDLPSSIFEILAQQLPSLLCAATIFLSSSSVHSSDLTEGSSLLV
mmetsp:Transcript_64201/g.157953  ORF Transcript_64201/g.157953 Transcript_64201/m.157953 type:complete len:296 (+) Transcript_64201:345-1232(+)